MPIFRSKQPHINVPEDVTVWQWLFESSKSPVGRIPESELAGFFDFPTKARINWREVKEAATHVSTALVKKYGFEPGDTVSLFSRNTIWYPVMMHGTTRIGGIVSGASPAYGVEEMTYALKTASARFLATSPTSMDVAKKAAAAAGIPDKHVFILEGELDGYTSIQSLIATGRSYGGDGQAPAFDVPRAGGKGNKEVCGFLSFSSGTTGLPKAVMISHHNMIAQCMQMELAYDPTLRRVLAVLPAFHITGLVHHMHVPTLLNAEVVMLPGFSMAGMLDAVVAHRITELLLVPPILIRLVRDPLVAQYDLGHVRTFSSGAAPPSPEVLQQLRRMFPHAGFKQGWGMTESTSCITMHTPDIGTWEYSHTVGTIVANTEIRIVREDGADVAGVGEPGEILARGPQVVMGYLDRPDATAETFDADGWLHTGDQGVMDDRGCIIITDRIKELIKVKGIGVAPAELEDVLLGHPDVEDAAVLAIPDDYSGELPKAYVVPKPNVKASEELGRAIISYIQDKKVRHKWLVEIEFIDAIPKSPSGKILRRELRDKEKSGKKGLFVRAEDKPRAKL